MQICIYEDAKYQNFYPLSYSRPVYDLVCGVRSLKGKILADFPEAEFSLHCRKYLEELSRLNNPDKMVNKIKGDKCLFINGRVLNHGDLKKLLSTAEKKDCIYKNGEDIVAVSLSGKYLEKIKSNFPDVLNFENLPGIPHINTEIKVANYLWDLISENGEQLSFDIKFLAGQSEYYKVQNDFSSVNFVNPDLILVGSNVTIKPGVVIDATNGPVLIDNNAFIFPNAVIEGPVYIGKNSKIKSGATIYENVSIGNVCKVGGELEDTVILPFSNKQHTGFIGHSYLGSWVNLGAATNCSDLKNNYGRVKVMLNGRSVDTGLQFLGLIAGDHSKSAINTMFNTGTIIGFSSNIFGAGFPDKYIPSFSWGGSENISTYDLKKGIETAKIVMKRREIDFSTEDEKLFKYIFDLTVSERNE